MLLDQLRHSLTCPQCVRHLELIGRLIHDQHPNPCLLLGAEQSLVAKLASTRGILQHIRTVLLMTLANVEYACLAQPCQLSNLIKRMTRFA